MIIIVLIGFILGVFPSNILAAQVLNQSTDSYDDTSYTVKCSGGGIITVTKVQNTYAAKSRGGFSSLNEAVSYGCKRTKNSNESYNEPRVSRKNACNAPIKKFKIDPESKTFSDIYIANDKATTQFLDAYNYCKNLKIKGSNKWELANRFQLRFIYNNKDSKPNLNDRRYYWSSTYGNDIDNNAAWGMYFDNGTECFYEPYNGQTVPNGIPICVK